MCLRFTVRRLRDGKRDSNERFEKYYKNLMFNEKQYKCYFRPNWKITHHIYQVLFADKILR